VLLVTGNVGKTLGQYASRWGASTVNLVAIDEIPDRRAHFASVGRMCENAVPVSFYGLHRGDDRR
jgi:ethanolamine utilization protein EutA